jgi:DNA mismatch endonuclease (patch repair protein)
MTRSEIMSRIRGDRLKPESALATELRRTGLRCARNAPELPGKPDVVFRRAKLAVFVHGCFWHGCARHYRRPKSNRTFWAAKLAGNAARDRRATRKLRALGYSVIVVWEHDLRRGAESAAARIRRALERHDKWTRPTSHRRTRGRCSTATRSTG